MTKNQIKALIGDYRKTPFDLEILKESHRKFEGWLKKYPDYKPPIDPNYGTSLGKYRYGDVETRAKHAFLRHAEDAYYGGAENTPQRAMRFKRASDKAFAIWMRELQYEQDR